jgi:hypothetical protein
MIGADEVVTLLPEASSMSTDTEAKEVTLPPNGLVTGG